MILCDTGPLVAAFNDADHDHSRCVRLLRENWSRLVVPSLAVTEVCHLLADPRRRGHTGLTAESARRSPPMSDGSSKRPLTTMAGWRSC